MSKVTRIRKGAVSKIPTQNGDSFTLPNAAVGSANLQDLSVTRGKLATGAVGKLNVTSTKTSAYPVVEADDLVPTDASGGGFTTTLYTAVGNGGRMVTIKRLDQTLANVVTIATSLGQTIDGVSTKKLATQNEEITLISDNANWIVYNRYIPSVATSFTMSITGSTSNPTKASSPSLDEARWRRVGDSIEITYTYNHVSNVGAAAGSGRYLFNLPTGLTMDTAKITPLATSDGGPCVGAAAGFNTAVGALDGHVYPDSSVAFGLRLGNDTNTPQNVGSTFAPLNSAIAKYAFRAIVPITNWEG